MKVTGSEKNNLLSSLLQFSIISSGRDGRDGRKGSAGARGLPGPRGIHYDLFRNRKDFTKKVNVKKQRRFDRWTVISKLKSKIFACAQIYAIDYKNAIETLTKL